MNSGVDRVMLSFRSVTQALCLLTLAFSGVGVTQEGKLKTPTHAPSLGNPGVSSLTPTQDVRTALQELMGRLRTHLRNAGQPEDLRCDAPKAWAYPGKIESAAAWIGRQVKRMGFDFSSEGQMVNSYAFTAITSNPMHPADVMIGGLIEGGPAIIAFLQRCHPNEL
jgi:hypothetical protein